MVIDKVATIWVTAPNAAAITLPTLAESCGARARRDHTRKRGAYKAFFATIASYALWRGFGFEMIMCEILRVFRELMRMAGRFQRVMSAPTCNMLPRLNSGSDTSF